MQLNHLAKRKQWLLFAGLVTVITAGALIMAISSKHHTESAHHMLQKKLSPNMTGVTSTDFNQDMTRNALTEQQYQTSELDKKIQTMNAAIQQMTTRINSLSSDNVLLRQQLDNEKRQVADKVTSMVKAPVSLRGNMNTPPAPGSLQHPLSLADENNLSGITSVSFTYARPEGPENPLLNRYIPSGTFINAVILEGADANASVSGQSNTSPMLFRLTGKATLPNDKTLNLSGCLVTASVYGDISSERGEVRLNNLSCDLADHLTIDTAVQGHVAFAGKEGIRGTPVMRNGKIIAWAGLSGVLSGIGSALQQSDTTQLDSPLGTMRTINGNRIWQSGLASGANTALNTLSQYYVKRADQYHPVIEIGSDNQVTIIFQKGFYLTPIKGKGSVSVSQTASKSETPDSTPSSVSSNTTKDMQVPTSVLQQIKTSQLGQTLPVDASRGQS